MQLSQLTHNFGATRKSYSKPDLVGPDEAHVCEALVDELNDRLLAVPHDDDLRDGRAKRERRAWDHNRVVSVFKCWSPTKWRPEKFNEKTNKPQ